MWFPLRPGKTLSTEARPGVNEARRREREVEREERKEDTYTERNREGERERVVKRRMIETIKNLFLTLEDIKTEEKTS